jgi:exosortase/archaeosortase family protein
MEEQTPVSARDTGSRRIRFVIGFVAVAAVLFGLYCFPYAENGVSEGWFTSYLSAYARVAGGVLSLIESNVTVAGTNIVGRFSLEIGKNCDAMEANILLLAAIVAFPSPWRRRLASVAVGLAILIAANVLRICSLYYVGVYFPTSFELMHLEVWPLLLIALAASEFALLATWMKRDEGSVAVAA